MQPLKKITHWFDTSALLITTAFLFAFIPLFPKIPLFDVLPGYIVRARAEDILVFITAIIWFVQVLRKKIAWKTPLTFLILLYICSNLIAT